MKKIAISLAVVATVQVLQSYTGPVQAAGYFRTWISATGDDVNGSTGCQPSAPCQTFGEALSQTTQGGEVNCLGPAEDGTGGGGETPIIISQNVTIDCHGTFGGKFSIAGANGVVISASGAVVTLRGLNLNGFAGTEEGAGTYGVLIEAAAVVNVEDCVIANYAQNGISDQRTTGSGQLFVRNTVLRNNGGSSTGLSGGINIVPGSGATTTVSISNSAINGNYFGIVGDGRPGGIIRATIKDSVVSGNTENGITMLSSGSSTVFMIDQTEVSGNLAGLFASGSNAGMLARNSTVFNNSIGLDAASGGTLYTYGNNSVNGNKTNGAFTGTAGLQ
jgi:hypothetical protein